jgi:hypothetical protein
LTADIITETYASEIPYTVLINCLNDNVEQNQIWVSYDKILPLNILNGFTGIRAFYVCRQ